MMLFAKNSDVCMLIGFGGPFILLAGFVAVAFFFRKSGRKTYRDRQGDPWKTTKWM